MADIVCMILAAPEFAWHGPAVVLRLSAVASAIVFVLYGVDKAAAKSGARRVPEKTLHLWSLLGGWPGALAAQRIFRHKTTKASFQLRFWFTVALNCAAVVSILSPPGDRFIRGLFGLWNVRVEPAEVRPDLPRITPRK